MFLRINVLFQVSELRELFWGRFTEEEIEILYSLNNSNKQLTVRYIFKCKIFKCKIPVKRLFILSIFCVNNL